MFYLLFCLHSWTLLFISNHINQLNWNEDGQHHLSLLLIQIMSFMIQLHQIFIDLILQLLNNLMIYEAQYFQIFNYSIIYYLNRNVSFNINYLEFSWNLDNRFWPLNYLNCFNKFNLIICKNILTRQLFEENLWKQFIFMKNLEFWRLQKK